MQSKFDDEPVVLTYRPGTHLAHSGTPDTTLNWPAPHRVQLIAPSSVPVLVIEPGGQSKQDPMLDELLHLPVAHCTHDVAPVPGPVSVMLPALQFAQAPDEFDPTADAYFPASQSKHALMLEVLLHLPAWHCLHDTAPGAGPVLVILPAPQLMHAPAGDSGLY